jgi:hypothetical protein
MNGEVFDRPPSDVRQTMTVIYYELTSTYAARAWWASSPWPR